MTVCNLPLSNQVQVAHDQINKIATYKEMSYGCKSQTNWDLQSKHIDLIQAHIGPLPEIEKASPTKKQALALNLM